MLYIRHLLFYVIELLLLVSHSMETGKGPAKMDIFYSIDDSASANWFKNDFNKNYEIFIGFVDFSFVPCKAIQLSSDGKKMTCSASNLDCYLDKLHSCATAHISDKAKLCKFIACTFEHGCGALSQCLSGDSALISTLDTCAKSAEGFNLCVANYNKLLPIEDIPSFGIVRIGSYALPFGLKESLCTILKREGYGYPNTCPTV